MKNRNVILKAAILAVGCFAVSLTAQAVSPAPDGGYTGNNTAEGTSALFFLTSGVDNTALGFETLKADTSGSFNTATGIRSLNGNVTGVANTADGAFTLAFNTASYNTATGYQALYNNTTGDNNTAMGYQALYHNSVGGVQNTAIGSKALYSNTGGFQNTATGAQALENGKGGNNTATGYQSLQFNSFGNQNTAIGRSALQYSTGDSNTALGSLAGSAITTGDNNIDIGYNVQGLAGESNTIRIGNTDITDTFIRGISGAAVASGATVFVASNGHLGTKTSSARFKDEIKPMDKASEVIFSLKPVTFRYKKDIDPAGICQFGLIAEDVEKVRPDLVVRDADGKPNTVRYEQVNAMLLNEFIKEHRTVQEQQKEIDALRAELRDQKALIQKVSAEVKLSKPAPRTVANGQ